MALTGEGGAPCGCLGRHMAAEVWYLTSTSALMGDLGAMRGSGGCWGLGRHLAARVWHSCVYLTVCAGETRCFSGGTSDG